MATLTDDLMRLCLRLDIDGRKALITLARSQTIPDPYSSPLLFAKVRRVLNELVTEDEFHSLSNSNVTAEGRSVISLITSPILTGLVIVHALGVDLPDGQVLMGRNASFDKEFAATQTRRRESLWNWDSLLDAGLSSDPIIHPDFPSLSKLQRSIRPNLLRFREQIKGRTIFPHYTNRGVSSETIDILRNKMNRHCGFKVSGNRSTFHRGINWLRVTSKDIVHHYIRSGHWIPGKTQMKQAWTPSNILPRTYFCWSGTDIANSSYLRNFFNSLADCFDPSHRHNRVQPSWLKRSQPDSSFAFYDLTSFTSWFHEHVPFLRAVARYFRNVDVYCLGHGLSLSQCTIGDLVDSYIDWCADFSEFCIRSSLYPELGQSGSVEFTHQCAGFLGIPGNLVMCTLPHALSLASLFDHPHSLQVPGDDVGLETFGEDHWYDSMRCASTLGVLQYEKVYRLPETSVYLKRLVLDLGSHLSLAPMLIYPLLPFLRSPSSTYQSNRFRLPPKDKLIERACSVMVTFMRDLWTLRHGELSADEAHIILLFLRRVHDQVGIPYGAIFQGLLYGEDGFERPEGQPSVTLKFPVDEDDCVFHNPDIWFAQRYVNVMAIRTVSDHEVSERFTELEYGTQIIVENRKVWRFLEDMGYVKVIGIPGEVVHLVGADARDAYLSATEPNLRLVRVLSSLSHSDLVALQICPEFDDIEFSLPSSVVERSRDYANRSWVYSRYIDLDQPSVSDFYRSRSTFSARKDVSPSLSPEPDDISMYY